ncbi:TetR/AcrR family transcriptional regulator [Halorhabdus sp. CBA1104]|uniref:TetR/AcrR family transcriptional regulator n=1 Tax=unclassified Halorhabdus TaxID=2621901 RepID=UPI0012B21227|nr:MULTISPECIES: TetR/AcrR family transcriptional regulator [unclassified Halorhabdus]QGN06426.1 TetR/AcrR family transcriptional regulator [Halorhabdus sp. CBA1104]
MEHSPQAPTDGHDEIMGATYRALCEYGYADLTIKRIAEEYGKTTAAIHYHYDTKDDLLLAFLDHILGEYVSTLHEVQATDPKERLELLVDKLLMDPRDHHDLLVALAEMRNQTLHKESFSLRFTETDQYISYLLETVIEQGISAGVFRDVEPAHVAQTLLMIVNGARARSIYLDEDSIVADARQAVDEYLSAQLFVESPSNSH